MALTCPKRQLTREHVTQLSKLLRETLQHIESAKEELVLAPLVKSLIMAVYTLTMKVEGAPDHNVMGALTAIHEDLNTTATTTQMIATTVMGALTTIHRDIKAATTTGQITATTAQQAALSLERIASISQDTFKITKGVAEAGKEAAVILQEMRDIAKAIQSTPTPKSTYASVLSSNIAPSSKPIAMPTDSITHSSTT